MQQTWAFRRCTVTADYAGMFTVTTFDDGFACPAVPEPTLEYAQTAYRLGYGEGDFAAASMSREHELSHTFLMERIGFPWSPTLWEVAHGQPHTEADLKFQRYEEALVCGFQQVLNGILPALHVAGYDLAAWRKEAWCLLRRLGR